MSVVGWAAIILGAFAAGSDALPLLYLLLTNNAQPGDLLPDGRVLSLAEYTHELEAQTILIAVGFLIKDSGRIFLFIKKTGIFCRKPHLANQLPKKALRPRPLFAAISRDSNQDTAL